RRSPLTLLPACPPSVHTTQEPTDATAKSSSKVIPYVPYAANGPLPPPTTSCQSVEEEQTTSPTFGQHAPHATAEEETETDSHTEPNGERSHRPARPPRPFFGEAAYT